MLFFFLMSWYNKDNVKQLIKTITPENAADVARRKKGIPEVYQGRKGGAQEIQEIKDDKPITTRTEKPGAGITERKEGGVSLPAQARKDKGPAPARQIRRDLRGEDKDEGEQSRAYQEAFQ